ncbi:microtubule-associated protein 4-like isoform X2 [Mizuhopecten yessoensis]|nr:microtubule-associated protein 4-like isoform X2 [Mizuhopecten yessoensis]
MADDVPLQGVTKETRNGDVHKHEAVGGFVLDFDKKADDGIYPTDDQKVPSAFCDEDTFMGDAPSDPVPREPEIPLGSDATSFPQQCEDFVGSNIDDSFSPFNSEMSSYSQTGSHESFPAFGGEREMDQTPEALPDPVPPMGHENVLIDFCQDSDQPTDVKCDNTNPFVDLSPGVLHPSDPYIGVEPNNGNNKDTEQIVQSPLRPDAPEFSPQGHSNAEFSPLRHDAPEFLPREPQQAAVFDQSPHSGGFDDIERNSLSQSDTFDKPNEQVQDVIDTFDKCKENVPVPIEEQSVPAINITSDQGEDDEEYSGEEDYSESESNSQAENDEIIEDDYTDSEDTENIQDSDDVSGGPGEVAGRPVLGDGIVHPAFDQGSVKPAFSENEFQFQQQGLAGVMSAGHVELMPSVGAEPPVVEGITEHGKGEQVNEMGSSQIDMAQDSTEQQQVGTEDFQRDTICKSETFTIESDSDMEERSITPEQDSMKAARSKPMSGQEDSQSAQAHGGASPPFNYSQMDPSLNQQNIKPAFNQGQIEPAFNQGQVEPAFNQGQMEPAFNQGQMELAFSQGQMEPAFSQEKMEPAFNQGQIEPAFNKGQMEPAINQGQVEPAFNQGQMEPAFSQGQMEPAFSQEQMEPAFNQGQIEPAFNQGQMEPAFSQEQMEPAFNQGQIEPAINQGQVEPAINQGQMDPAFNQGQVEPAFNKGQMEPAINQGQVEPAINQGQMDPAFNQGQVEPAFNMGQMEPAFNQEQMDPAFNQEQMDPAFNQGQVEPAFNQGQVEPAFNKGQMEPAFNQEQMDSAFNQGQVEPAFNKGQMEPSFNQGQVEPAFNQGQIEPIKKQMQNEQKVLASNSETGNVGFCGDDDMFTNQPALQQEPDNKQQVVSQDEQQTDFQNDMMPSEGFTEDPMFPLEDTSKMELSPNKHHEQPDCREDVVTPREVLLEDTSEQKYQMEKSGVEHDQTVPLMSPCQQLEDAGFSQVFSQVVDDSFMDNENTQTNTETLGEPNTQTHAYEDEEGDGDEDRDEDMHPDDQYSSSSGEEEEGAVSQQPKQQDAAQLMSSKERLVYQQEEKTSSEERSASLQQQKLTSEERSLSPEECDRNENPESNFMEKSSLLSESQDKLASEERSLSPECHPSNDQKKIEEQRKYEEQNAPQSFEKETPPFVHEMVPGEIDQSTIDETYGVAPATFEASELERISSHDQAPSPATVDTDRDAHTSGRNSEDFEYEQGEDSLTAEGGSDSDQDLPKHSDEDVDVQPNITDDSLADQPVHRETILKEINEEQERLEAGRDMKESGMGESIITADSQETDDQSPSEIPRQMLEDYGDTERSLTSSMECQTYEDDAGVSPVEMAASLMEGSMVLKEGETNIDGSSLSQSVPTESALEEYSKDRMEDEEIENIKQQLSSEVLEVEPKSAHLDPQLRVTEDISVREDVQEVHAAEEEVVSPAPIAETPVQPTADQQVVVQKFTTAVQHASTPETGTEKTDVKQDKLADKMEGAPTKNVVKKINEPAEKKSQVTEKIDRKEAKQRKQEKPITKTPQKPLRKPKQRTPPKSDESKIPSPTKTEGGITKSTTRTLRSAAPSKTAPPRSLNMKQSTEKPPFDTSFPRAVSASRQRILPLAQTPSTPSPTKAPSMKIPTRTQNKEATQLFLERMSRPRCRTPKKDGASDSGVEEDKTPRATSATSQRKKYGIDAKNENYKPGGGNVKITDQKVTVKHVGSKIDARSKTPTGSPRKDATAKAKPTTPKGSAPDTKHVQSKIDSLKNSTHSPGGGNVKIAHQKVDYSTVQGKIGSKANLDHRPKGGDKKILSKKLEWKAESRVGSLDNAKHAPGGGKVKILDEKVQWNTGPRVGSLDNAKHAPGGGNVKILDEKVQWNTGSRIGSLENAKHAPGGGNVKIETAKLDFKGKAISKVGSKDNMDHKAGGGDKKIETKKLDFKEKASSKVGSKDNVTHRPGGGDKKIESHKLTFKESAKPATDSGTGHVASSPPCRSPSLKSPRPDSGISQDSLPQQVTSPDNMDSSVTA